ncbi:hypothetical protein SAMN05421819_2898 [Bryocella elongata]|uniref:DUF3108 domain-containing protein n=2 Tax=Bryocella elongata TaxID=863522 RepID=A0A1H6A3U3_9BACT|nr:hypothetical protein SAMN05421819_2898 [Bryocella elongata]
MLRSAGFSALVIASSLTVASAQMEVKHTVGALHGFLVIRSEGGVDIGSGEVSEFAEGDRVTVKTVYRFRDGSLDEETAVFNQRKSFQFVSDHHIQSGRFFPKPSDITIDASGQVTMRSTDKDGKAKVETTKMDVAPGLSNGVMGTILQNIAPNAPEFKLDMIVPAGKPRAIKLDVAPAGKQSVRIAGLRHETSVFRLKTEIGGVAGVIAPMVGKQPPDIFISIIEGEVPVIVRILGPLGEGTAVVDIQLAGATFPRSPASH